MTLKVSISGVRGIVGKSLTNKVVLGFSKAFAIYTRNGKIAIGNDGRPSCDILKTTVISELNKNGCKVIDSGICPTPTLQLSVKDLSCDGGIIITASHNPIEWNGLKFVSSKGIFLNEDEAKQLIRLYEDTKNDNSQETQNIDVLSYKKDDEALTRHIQKVLSKIPSEKIKEKQFKVAIDCCNGGGSKIVQKLLKELGCEIIAINTEPKKSPNRGLEPIPQNLWQLEKLVKEFNADIGFALDPDADRLSIVSDKGKAIGEEYSLSLATFYILSNYPKKAGAKIVTNLSTSKITEDIAKQFGADVIRTKVGEINVSEKIKETGAILGGEGNGGVIWPEIGLGRDSISGIGIILSLLAQRNQKVSDIIDLFPKYTMVKDKILLPSEVDVRQIIEKISHKYKNGNMNTLDGIKIDFDDSWIHIRPSNTEPIIRIIAEAKDEEKAHLLINESKKIVGELI